MRRAVLPLLLLGSGTACLWQGEPVELGSVDTRVTFLHTADLHSRLVPGDRVPGAAQRALGLHPRNGPFGGAARLGYLIARERSRAGRVLHVDGGGALGGGPLFAIYRGEPELRFASHVGVDAAVLGDHALSQTDGAGADNLVDRLARFAAFDVLAANYDFPDPVDPFAASLADVTRPFSLHNVGGVRIAIIGLANLGLSSTFGEGDPVVATRREANETLRAYVNLLHGTVDLIAVLSHLGLARDRQLVLGYDKTVAAASVHPSWEVREQLGDGRVVVRVPGVRSIDLIFGGHSHVTTNPPLILTDTDGRRVLIVHSGAYGEILGRLDVILRDDPSYGGKQIVAHVYQAFPVDARLAPYADPGVAELLAPYLLSADSGGDLTRVIGYAPATLLRLATRGGGDSALGNLVAEATRRHGRFESEAAVVATALLGDDLHAGPVTAERLYDVIPFDSLLARAYLRGSELQQLADVITARSASRGCAAIAQVAGMSLTLNCGQVVQNERDPQRFQHPSESIEINGGPLIGDRTYSVAIDDRSLALLTGHAARRSGKVSPGVSVRNALAEQIATMTACGEYELTGPRICLQRDEFSQAICADTVDCARYIAACEAGCLTDDASGLPSDNVAVPIHCGGWGTIVERGLCNGAGGASGAGGAPIAVEDRDCFGRPEIRGAYADLPCVVSREDGRLQRRTAAGLDGLTDGDEDSL